MQPMPDLLTLVEGAPPLRVPLAQRTALALQDCGAVTVARTESAEHWLLSDAGQIGVIHVGGHQITIKPKVAVDRLVFMMGYARKPGFWREDRVRLDSEEDLTEALAETFRRFASKALEQGLLKGYVTVEETTTVLRGRMREAEQLKRRYGRLIPLEVTYDDYTVDIAENRILLAAARHLLKLPGLRTSTRRGLTRIVWQLADVTLPTTGGPLPSWWESRLNSRYVPALRVAEVVLQGRSFEQRRGDLAVSGFVFSMAKVFEDFVCVALSEAMKSNGGRSELQYKTHLDVDQQVRIRPDYVWAREGPRIVVDAKYKAEKPAGFPQADLYQLLAYCTVLGLDDGHLIYASGNEEPRVHEVVRAGIRIHCHTLDLTDNPLGLIAQVHRLAAALGATSEPRADLMTQRA